MARPDLNLLVALDVLLDEGSVAASARRLRLSPSAMSRTLARLRAATGDPLLVRAGRRLVATPHALALRDRVGPIVQEAEAVLRPARGIDLARLERTFTVRSSEGFVETFGPAILDVVSTTAPRVRLWFAQKPDKESAALRSGSVDLETGVVEASTGPELIAQALFRDRYVAVLREGHPFVRGQMTQSRYASGRHVGVARLGQQREPIDEMLESSGIVRDVVVIVGGFASALALARSSDLIATVPERHTGGLRAGMRTVPLPIALPEFTVSLLWHPRLGADPAHRWLRGCIRDVCAARVGGRVRE